MALNAKEVVENVNTTKKTSPYLGYGIKEIKINDVEFRTASTGSLKLVYKAESKPITEEGFQPVDGASGQVGSIQTSYIKPDSKQEKEAFGQLITFCKKAGVDTDSFPEFNTIQEAVAHILPLIKGKFVRVKLVAKWYMGKDKDGNPKEKYNLEFARFAFAEEVTIPMTSSTLRFDENSPYDMDKRELKKESEEVNVSTSNIADLF